MSIYYTKSEGGQIYYFPKKISRRLAYKILKENWRTGEPIGEFHGTAYSYLKGIKVHSVFFTSKGKLRHIWDSFHKGPRPDNIIFIRNMPVPKEWQRKI